LNPLPLGISPIFTIQGTHSTYKKLAVQWLNEALYLVSSFVVADCLVFRNRQLLVAANRCMPLKKGKANRTVKHI